MKYVIGILSGDMNENGRLDMEDPEHVQDGSNWSFSFSPYVEEEWLYFYYSIIGDMDQSQSLDGDEELIYCILNNIENLEDWLYKYDGMHWCDYELQNYPDINFTI